LGWGEGRRVAAVGGVAPLAVDGGVVPNGVRAVEVEGLKILLFQ